jgi:hypothetical protein
MQAAESLTKPERFSPQLGSLKTGVDSGGDSGMMP